VSKLFRGFFIVCAALVLATLGYIFVPTSAGEPQPVAVAVAVPPLSPVLTTTALPRDELSLPEPAPLAVAPRYAAYTSFVYIPTRAQERQPLQVVIALHGMGGEGKSFSAGMIKEAERNGWVLVAPTIEYGDWHNPEAVATEEIETTRRLIATIDDLTASTALALKPRVDVYGFSRGAQLAHRFAIFFPERVDRVVAFSAGTYTLPDSVRNVPGDGKADSVMMPYGVADLQLRLGHAVNASRLRQVQFMIGVGAADNASADVPRQWDEYLGKTRVERALEFTRAMLRHGVPCSLKVYPSVGHELTQPMLNTAVLFFTDPTPAVTPLLQ
jgi:predicted esterase